MICKQASVFETSQIILKQSTIVSLLVLKIMALWISPDRRLPNSRFPNDVIFPTLLYLGPHMLGRFGQMRVYQLTQKIQIESFCTISYTKSKLKQGPFYQKIANSCFGGPTMQTIADKWGCLPIGPKVSCI